MDQASYEARFGDLPVLDLLTRESPVFAEAAESVDKCVVYCHRDPECFAFAYSTFTTFQGRCFMYGAAPAPDAPAPSVFDTTTDYVGGLPPRARAAAGDRVMAEPDEVVLEEANGYTGGRAEILFVLREDAPTPWSSSLAESSGRGCPDAAKMIEGGSSSRARVRPRRYAGSFDVFLGGEPLRGAVWVTPTVDDASLDVTFDPPGPLVFYNASERQRVAVSVQGVTTGATPTVSFDVIACDVAFGLVPAIVRLIVRAPPRKSSSSNNKAKRLRKQLVIAAIVVACVLGVVGMAWLFFAGRKFARRKAKLEADRAVQVARRPSGNLFATAFNCHHRYRASFGRSLRRASYSRGVAASPRTLRVVHPRRRHESADAPRRSRESADAQNRSRGVGAMHQRTLRARRSSRSRPRRIASRSSRRTSTSSGATRSSRFPPSSRTRSFGTASRRTTRSRASAPPSGSSNGLSTMIPARRRATPQTPSTPDYSVEFGRALAGPRGHVEEHPLRLHLAPVVGVARAGSGRRPHPRGNQNAKVQSSRPSGWLPHRSTSPR